MKGRMDARERPTTPPLCIDVWGVTGAVAIEMFGIYNPDSRLDLSRNTEAQKDVLLEILLTTS